MTKLIKTCVTAELLFTTLLYTMSVSAEQVPQTVYQSYMAAVDGDTSSTKKTFKALSELHDNEPDNVLINAMLGSTETLLARDAWVPWKKLKYAEIGLSRMDRSLKNADNGSLDNLIFEGLPTKLWINTTVGCTFIEMPEMFDRLETGYQLLVDSIQSAAGQKQDVKSLAAMYLCAGKAAEKKGDMADAVIYLDKLLKAAPDAEEATEAALLLSELQ